MDEDGEATRAEVDRERAEAVDRVAAVEVSRDALRRLVAGVNREETLLSLARLPLANERMAAADISAGWRGSRGGYSAGWMVAVRQSNQRERLFG